MMIGAERHLPVASDLAALLLQDSLVVCDRMNITEQQVFSHCGQHLTCKFGVTKQHLRISGMPFLLAAVKGLVVSLRPTTSALER